MVSSSPHRPRKRFGQNFLVDPTVVGKIVRAINPRPGERIVEIGPGRGALTGELLQCAGSLDVIEIDRDLAAYLVEKIGNPDRLTVHRADALTFDFSTLADNGPLRMIGNLPYNISTPLLFHLFGFSAHIADMHLMLQKEVVDRLAASPSTGDYGRLSVMAQYHARITPLFTVGPAAFRPSPKVNSAVVRLDMRPPEDCAGSAALGRVVKQAFSKRRKTLHNNLKDLLDDDQIRACGIDPGLRAEALGLADFVRLAEQVNA